MSPSSSDSANLDLLRSVAVLLVLFSHLVMVLGGLDTPISNALRIRDLAQLGVLLFFIHTSLVLMHSLDRIGDSQTFRRFYIRRAFRIYPLAVLTVIVTLLAGIPPHFEPVFTAPSAGTIVANLLLVQNLFRAPDVMGPMWSLPLEVQMYVLLPILHRIARRALSLPAVAGLVGAGFAVWYVDSHVARALGTPPLAQYAPWFFMGVSSYALGRQVARRWSSAWFVVMLAAFAAAPVLTPLVVTGYRAGWVSWATGVVFALALPLFHEIRRVSVRTVVRWIATYSYGIYLAHVPIMWLVFQRGAHLPDWVKAVAFLSLIGSIPVVIFHTIEAPLIALGKRVSDSLFVTSPRPSVPVSAQSGA